MSLTPENQVPATKPWLRRGAAVLVDGPREPKPLWNRVGLIGIAATLALVWATERSWPFAILAF